jgi:hypothetical protein
MWDVALGFAVAGLDEQHSKLDTASFQAMIKKSSAGISHAGRDWGAVRHYDGEFYQAGVRQNLGDLRSRWRRRPLLLPD